VFAAIDPARWERCGRNPVRFLIEVPAPELIRAAQSPEVVAAVRQLDAALSAELGRPTPWSSTSNQPVAFLCAEFAVHPSLPIYSGGLGVLAGDILKQASDLGVPMVGVGLLYRTGYFHQRLDVTGLQHEYWTELDTDLVPVVLVTADDGEPLRVTVPIHGEDVVVQIWRVDVGRVPLYLLDSDVPGNSRVARWVTSRLYEGNRDVRLAQYGVLGLGGVRALRSMGIYPSVFHLNEGHAALAALALVEERLAAGAPADVAWSEAHRRLVFTTHTPVPAGNETYDPQDAVRVLGDLFAGAGDPDAVLAMGRADEHDAEAQFGLSTLAVRAARSVNAVSRRHGEVAREMWRFCWPDRSVADIPISHVTNGVHIATWLVSPMRELLAAYLGDDWVRRGDDQALWAAVSAIPDRALWAAHETARRALVETVVARATVDRLRRGEGLTYSAAAALGFRPDVLTIGFARRLASYKRFHLLVADASRALSLLGGERPVQILLAGKAHPQDETAKQGLQLLFALKGAPQVAGRVAFLEDYDVALASAMVAGCDVWVNLPRPPLEASGTSGMKAAVNGGLNLSVLDGWWTEVYDGTNGWAIDGDVDADTEAQDRRHGARLYDLLEHEIIPLFYERDWSGVPRGWVAMMKRSLQTVGPFVAASRMVRQYVENVYELPVATT
jgi:starch phosphorylase